jgi:hypothetical protein
MFPSPAPLCLHISDIRHLISDVFSYLEETSKTKSCEVLQAYPLQFSFHILNPHRLLSNSFVYSTTVVVYAQKAIKSFILSLGRCGRKILGRRMTSAFTRDPHRSSPEVRPRTDSAKQVDAIS